MGFPTKIQYAHGSWSPWFGCSKVSPGCEHCFAEAWAKRSGMVKWGPGQPRRLNKNWNEPKRWDANAKAAGTRYRILTDLCDPLDREVKTEWLAKFFALIHDTPNLDWLFLTKRIAEAHSYIGAFSTYKNIWIGITVCNQEEADRDIPVLLSIPATKRWISYEPALGPIVFREEWLLSCKGCDNKGSTAYAMLDKDLCQRACIKRGEGPSIDFVVAGCESGPKRRHAPEKWFWDVKDQCQQAGVPYFLKQMEINGKIVHLPELDGKVWKEIPE